MHMVHNVKGKKYIYSEKYKIVSTLLSPNHQVTHPGDNYC